MAFCKATWITVGNQLVLLTRLLSFLFKITFLFWLHHWSFFIAVLVEMLKYFRFHTLEPCYVKIFWLSFMDKKEDTLWSPFDVHCFVIVLWFPLLMADTFSVTSKTSGTDTVTVKQCNKYASHLRWPNMGLQWVSVPVRDTKKPFKSCI